MRRFAGALRATWFRFGRDHTAVAAVEFALVLPFMLLIVLGGFQIEEGVSAYRKVTLTTRTVADLTTQYGAMSGNDITTVLNASAQVMAPFNTSTLTIVLSELQSNATATSGSVVWSKTLNGTALTQGAVVPLPTGLVQPNSAVVLSSVSYSYMPPIAYKITGPYSMSDTLYMVPRQVATITYTGP